MSDSHRTQAGQTGGATTKTFPPSDHEAITKAARGIPDRTASTLSFVAGTRTFTITPVSGAFSYYIAGRRYIKSAAESIVIADTSGMHWIHYDGATLTDTVNPTHAQLEVLIEDAVRVGLVYWNATDGAAYILGDERHGPRMSGDTQDWLHDVLGSQWIEGFDLSGYVLNSDADVDVQFEATDGKIYDEDLDHDIVDGAAANQYEQQLSGTDAEIPILYRDDVDGSWTEDAASVLPYKHSGADRLAFNNDDLDGTWSQVEVDNNKFLLATLVATNDWQYPIKMIQGQAQYATRALALEGAETEQIAWDTMPSPELVVLYRFLLQTNTGFGGTKNLKIIEIIDLRRLSLTGGAAAPPQPHAILSNTHSDSLAAAVTDGALLYGTATPEWAKHPLVTLDAAGVMSGLTELAMGAHDITALAFAHVGPGGGIKSNTLGNIELGFQAFTIGAVNYLYIISAWAGAAPSLTVEGADANIDLALGGKGTGIVKSLDDFDVTGDITVSGLVDGVDIAGTVVTADANLTDDRLVRGKGGALGTQTSLAILSDAGALSGLTQLDVDNLRIDGNTISSTDLSTIYLDPGTTEVQINTLGAAAGNQFALIMANSVWNAAMIDTRTSFSFWQAYTAGGDMWSTAQITAGTETNWTAVANSQDGYLAFYTTLNAVPAEKMRITSAGVVGINTDDPGGIHGSAMLDIRKDALCAIALYSFVAAATNDSRVFAARARGVDGAPAIVQNGAPPDSLFTFQSLGYDGAGYTTGAIMSFVVDGAPGVGVMPAAIVFKTAAGAPVERLRIQSDGDILVDTDSKMMFRDSDLYWYSPGDGVLHGDADTRISLEAPTVKVTATAFEVSNTNGIDIGISVDGDIDLITVDVTGAPRQWWDETADAFVMTHRLDLTAGGVQTQYSTDDVADPPTDAELDAAFGDPTVVGPGFVGILDDGGAGLYCYICFTTGTAGEWFYIAGAKAV